MPVLLSRIFSGPSTQAFAGGEGAGVEGAGVVVVMFAPAGTTSDSSMATTGMHVHRNDLQVMLRCSVLSAHPLA